MAPEPDPRHPLDFPKHERIRVERPIRRVRQEDLPGIQPTLFRELDHRIAQTRLEHEPLPDTFLRCESGERGGTLVFRGERYDLNITLFAARPEPRSFGRGSGVFVVSNGAGVATNTVDQLSSFLCIAGMIDLKQDFSEAKIAAAFEMVRSVRPDLDALVINMISGLAVAATRWPRSTGSARPSRGGCRSSSASPAPTPATTRRSCAASSGVRPP